MSSNLTPGVTAQLTVRIKTFQAIGHGNIDAEFALTGNAGGAVTIDPKDFTIAVKRPVVLAFLIDTTAITLRTILPIGIAFQSLSAPSADPLGAATFPVRHVDITANGVSFVIHDTAPRNEEFKYTLVLQHPDGRVGVIDPKIRNVPLLP